MQTERFDTIVIGAGQAGLVTGYHLQRAGRSFVILDGDERDRRRAGASATTRSGSSRRRGRARLDGMPFPSKDSTSPTKDEFADYLEAYATRFALPVRTGVRVDGVRRDGDRYVVSAGDRTFEATNVVVASGAHREPRVPVVRGRPRSVDRPAALQRVPEPVTAAGRSCARRRRRELGSRHRVGGREDPPDHDVGEPDRAHPRGHRRLDRAQRRVPPDPVPGRARVHAPQPDRTQGDREVCPRRATCSCA